MLMLDVKKESWWFWLVSAALLTVGVLGRPDFFRLTILLTVIQLVYFSLKLKSVTCFPIQVRIGYLALLLLAQPPALQWIYWIPTIGTWAQVLVGYCLMARCVSMLPWNRQERFTLAYLGRTLFSKPVAGSVQQTPAAEPQGS
ncbi:MAG: hypothetical protein C0622_04125 [Desulfuromonas sp.]|nr:MAG: hypothetical protein C0622_04125 [Desulfuromonas sp.]